MYRSVHHIITAYLKKYTLARAIQRARQERAASRTPEGFRAGAHFVDILTKE